MTTKTIIDKIFSQPPFDRKKDKVKELMTLLGVSKSAIYSRLNHTTSFSFEEMVLICQHYNISLDDHVLSDKKNDKWYPFYSDTLKYMPRTYLDYLHNIKLHATYLAQVPEATISLVVNEFNIFHLLPYDSLMYLKLFMWNMASWNDTKDFIEYTPSKLQADSYKSVRDGILEIYRSKSTHEIWTPNMMQNLINSIKHLNQAGLLDEQSRSEIATDLRHLYSDIESMLRTGAKLDKDLQPANSITIWSNDAIVSTELIIVESEFFKGVFMMLDVPNYFRSTSLPVCKHMIEWLDRVRQQSTEITHSSKLKRLAFLKRFKADVDSLGW